MKCNIKIKLCLLKNIDRMSIEICKVNKLHPWIEIDWYEGKRFENLLKWFKKMKIKSSSKGKKYAKSSQHKDFYSSTDESNEDTNSNSERVLSASSTKAFLWSSKLRWWQCLMLGTFGIFFSFTWWFYFHFFKSFE
jgi:hypothetical protein